MLTEVDLENVLSGHGMSFSTVSALAWDYFRDRASYRKKLTRSLTAAQAKQDQLTGRLRELKADAAAIEAFLGYGEGWLDQKITRKESAETEVHQLQETIRRLSAEFAEAKAELERKRKEKDTLAESLGTVHSHLRSFDDLMAGLGEEKGLISQLEESRNRLRKLEKELSDKAELRSNLRKILDEMSGQLKSLDELQ